MTRHRKKYSRDFKPDIIAQVGSGITPSIRIAGENGIYPMTFQALSSNPQLSIGRETRLLSVNPGGYHTWVSGKRNTSLSPSRYVALHGGDETIPPDDTLVRLNEAEEGRMRREAEEGTREADRSMRMILKEMGLVV